MADVALPAAEELKEVAEAEQQVADVSLPAAEELKEVAEAEQQVADVALPAAEAVMPALQAAYPGSKAAIVVKVTSVIPAKEASSVIPAKDVAIASQVILVEVVS